MDPKLPASQEAHPSSDAPLHGAHPQARRKPAGRPPKPTFDTRQIGPQVQRVIEGTFPGLNARLNGLPDLRRQEFCLYSGAHIWWQIISTFLLRTGSRNALDEGRLSGELPWNFGQLCGQTAEDPRFGGTPTVTCSDNAAHHANRVDPSAVSQLPLYMGRELLRRRLFDAARLFDGYHLILIDGTVQEKCRQGFTATGKSSGSGAARYRYVLQALILGPQGVGFPLMHEAMDMHDPVAEKEDCELKTFGRLSQRLKREFPRLLICIIGDALYACEPVVRICEQYQWKYILTLKEGRQPTLWLEMLELLPMNRVNRLCLRVGQDGRQATLGYRWVPELMLGTASTAHALLLGEVTPKCATLYAYLTNFKNLSESSVPRIVEAGRKRHIIEDHFNIEKNHGIGLEHVFCAHDTAAKNYFTMMQVAQILWNLLYHGCLKRLPWARDATQKGLARALGESLRAFRLPTSWPPLGQLRFSSA